MGKINILTSEIFNRIAAGEVVEKPASVMKELVENSIDAGATQVKIEVYDGGRHIRVTDNGSGMEEEDVVTAFLPHATSKIASLNDLDRIGTLGFRGEAIPSIAAVARVEITSRRPMDELATKVTSINGKIESNVKCGSAIGTVVDVSDLFKNIPARLKFLRKDKTEENDISSLADKLILANYNVKISLFINGKEVRSSTGGGLNEAVFAVYGKNFLSEHSYINSSMSGVTLYGYVNKPAFSRHNRNSQTLIVNGRYVVNSDVSFWIYTIYSPFLMKRQYPSFVLYVDIPTDMVDINVHPSKIEVKFVDFNIIRKLLNSAIYSSLEEQSSEPKEVHLGQNETSDTAGESVKTEPKKTGVFDFLEHENTDVPFKSAAGYTSHSGGLSFRNTPHDIKKSFQSSIFDSQSSSVPDMETGFVSAKAENKVPVSDDVFYDRLDGYRYAGKLFNTYIILEGFEDFIMIDQHAAHEKLLFEKYSAAIEKGSVQSQGMMFPHIFELDYGECEQMDALLPELNKIGFDISRLSGNSYSMSAFPLSLTDFDPVKFINSLTLALDRGSVSKITFIRDEVIQMSCKAAVKGEMNLSELEISELLKDIKQTRIELFCPHGRPIAVKFSKSEIEKWFKRIV